MGVMKNQMAQLAYFGLFFAISTLFRAAIGQQQVFLMKPTDMDAVAGSQVTMKCRIGNQAGKVQWTKNGFALGFRRDIPGYPGYKIIGSQASGVHDLRIANVTLDEDADFQCQVGATAGNRGIRATAHLTVLLPPQSVSMEGHKNGSSIEVKEDGEVKLTCIIKEGKPAAKASWYRENVKLEIESEDYRVEDTGEEQRQNAISTITINPSAEDNDVTYSCQAEHAALTFPMKSIVRLSVLYPPGPPEIQGYREGEAITKGETVTLSCISRGGNPLAQVFWYKNNEQVDYSYTTRGRNSINSLTFEAGVADNNAIFRCDALNKETEKPMNATVKLTVQFSPGKPNITGPSEASAGDIVTMQCKSGAANPPAEIFWKVDGRTMPSTSVVTADPNGGWVSASNLTVTLTGSERSVKTFTCFASNKPFNPHESKERNLDIKMLTILHPPDRPTIYGYREGTALQAGSHQRLNCVSMGGNPLATVSWFKGDEKLESKDSQVGTSSYSEIMVTVQQDDNGAEYRCEAINSAIKEPLVASKRMTVHFPPSGVKIKVWPPVLKSGQQAVLTCESASSNPASTVTWWKEDFMISGEFNGTIEAPNGGKSTRNKLKLNITSQNDGSMYTCQATNKILQLSVHDGVTLSVKYKPEFYTIPSDKFDILEGGSTVINMKARGNPSNIEYLWTRNGEEIPLLSESGNDVSEEDESSVQADGSELHVSNAGRFDAGEYTLKAVNDEGSSINTIIVNIQYESNITDITSEITVYEGDHSSFSCEAAGNPITKDMITWRREGFDFDSRAKVKQIDRKSYLTIYNVSASDVGKFECVSNNGIGDDSVAAAFLLMRTKPHIDMTSKYSRGASDEGGVGKLTCRATGAPAISFMWSREGKTLDTEGEKYDEETSQIDFNTWESVLSVKSVIPSEDYGDYLCVAKNEEGFFSYYIKLEDTGKPDIPISIKVLKTTHNTALLTWIPGFDGGLEQSFRIRYRKTTHPNPYKYDDPFPKTNSTHLITGLDSETQYQFSVLAYNTEGESEYTEDNVIIGTSKKIDEAKTSSDIDDSDRKTVIPAVLGPKSKVPQIVIISVSVVGAFLLLLNVFLVSCFIYRKRKKRFEEDDSDRSSSKAATVEMYSYANSNNGTVTGETLSSISEKSEQYSDEHSVDNYPEEGSKAVSTYLTDGNNPPTFMNNSRYNYKEKDQGLHSPKISNRSMLSDPDVVPHSQEEDYVDALRRNAFNMSVSEKTGYGKTPVGHPPPPPNRTASSGVSVPSELFYNLSPPSNLSYPTYPNGSATLNHSSPQRNPTYVSGEYRPPVLSTFIASANSPVSQTLSVLPRSPSRSVPPELDGHLV